MAVGPPSTDSIILHHLVTKVTDNRQKPFVFVYRSGIEKTT